MLRLQDHPRAAHRPSAPVVAQRLRAAESLQAPPAASRSARRFPTAGRQTSASARSATACPARTRSPFPSTACRSSFAAATGASTKRMKRIPRERLDAQIRMHRLANLNLIRNWVGQSTSEDLYELCDKYGILVWDEFFQPNPGDGPDPTDLDTYMANVRDKILRFRNHPSIIALVRAQRGLSAAGDRRRPAQDPGRAGTHAPLPAQLHRRRRACAPTAPTTGAPRASFTLSPTTTSKPRPAPSPCPHSNPSMA